MKSCKLVSFYLLGVVALSSAFAPSDGVVRLVARSRQRSMSGIRMMVANDNLSDEIEPTTGSDSDIDSFQPKGNIIARLGGMMGRKKDAKLLDRKALAKLGANVLLAYGFVSNAFGCVSVSCAWYISSKRVSRRYAG
jgi:hypothetical protein